MSSNVERTNDSGNGKLLFLGVLEQVENIVADDNAGLTLEYALSHGELIL